MSLLPPSAPPRSSGSLARLSQTEQETPWYACLPKTALWVIGIPKLLAVILWWRFGWRVALPVFFCPSLWFMWQLFIPSAPWFGKAVTRFHTQGRNLWLTIDDGPDPETTPQVLTWLDAHQAKATFFLIGEKAARYPELVREIQARGHAIGNHSHRHPLTHFWLLGPRRLGREIDEASHALGGQTFLFRSPAGIKNPFLPALLKQRNTRLILWNRRGFDSILPAFIAFPLLTKWLRSGDILLLHEHRLGQLNTLLPRVLQQLQKEGFSCIVPESKDLR